VHADTMQQLSERVGDSTPSSARCHEVLCSSIMNAIDSGELSCLED
jgi:hypothetical protein